MNVNDRVRKYRHKLRTQDRRRLEVWLGTGLIEQIRQIASVKNAAIGSVVQEALEAYLTVHAPQPSYEEPARVPSETEQELPEQSSTRDLQDRDEKGRLRERRRLIAESRRLTHERSRLLRQADSPEHRHQIVAYNQRIAAFNERLTRFNSITNPHAVSNR